MRYLLRAVPPCVPLLHCYSREKMWGGLCFGLLLLNGANLPTFGLTLLFPKVPRRQQAIS